ncbi:DUF4436 family protein [Mycolicibacterium neworleansense]|uniref:Transmembrane protein n=1 Tax=Mycolicibacterium neworleansense TaxID=146018 RepID=A0A0H5RVN2_9MYCO|nr:DUF4436 family protein [Mycolicibacterium neworleansense]CRZ17597.1 transmembrane protein [Mycolicibacterium neworleansense]
MVLVLVIAASMELYLLQRDSNYTEDFGALDTIDRVNVQVWISRLDTTSETLDVEITSVTPSGALADPDGGFRRDIVLNTSAFGAPLTVKQHDTGTDTERRFAVNGTITDYPFDRYSSLLTFDATDTAGAVLPIAVSVWSSDPFFRNTPAAAAQADAAGHGTAISLTSTRSTPTMVFAVFVMVLMLGLAAAAVTASYYILRWRRGLLFPACSMMAALLFALIPFRNAVPGNPPIGSVIDFASFFIAETVIAVALIASVVVGYRYEITNERAADVSAVKTEPDPFPQKC